MATISQRVADTAVDGLDLVRLDGEGRIIELTAYWRPLAAAQAVQVRLSS